MGLSPVNISADRTERQKSLIGDAVELAGDVSDASQLVGYVIVSMYSDGSGRSAGYRPNAEEHSIGSSLWEAWVRASIEKHFMYKEGIDATYDVLNGRN